jgi:hypothetical protein
MQACRQAYRCSIVLLVAGPANILTAYGAPADSTHAPLPAVHVQDAGSKKGGRRVAVQPPMQPRPQVPAGLESSLQQFDELEAQKT